MEFPINEYNMTKQNGSTFLDIGSGFGKPVFHAAMQTGCWSLGIEILSARVGAAMSLKWDFHDQYRELRRATDQ